MAAQTVVCLYFADYGLYQLVQICAGGVVGRGEEIHSALIEEPLCYLLLLLVARLVDGNGGASHLTHQLHTGHICLSISKVNHIVKGNALLLLRYGFVYLYRVAYAEDALVYLKEKLCLVGVVYCRGGPHCISRFVVVVRAGKERLKLICYGGALNNLL